MSWKRSSSSEKRHVADERNSFITGRNRSPRATGCDRWNSISRSTSLSPLRRTPMSFSSSPMLHRSLDYNIYRRFSQRDKFLKHSFNISLHVAYPSVNVFDDGITLLTLYYFELHPSSVKTQIILKKRRISVPCDLFCL